MSRIPARFGTRNNATIVAFGLFVLIATVFTVFGLTHSGTAPAATSTATVLASNRRISLNSEQVEAELITVRRDGIDPKEVTRPMGRFILVVDNRSGVGDLALRLEGGPGRSRVNGRIPFKKLSWRTPLELPPGTYTLREANHSDWVCRITIKAR